MFRSFIYIYLIACNEKLRREEDRTAERIGTVLFFNISSVRIGIRKTMCRISFLFVQFHHDWNTWISFGIGLSQRDGEYKLRTYRTFGDFVTIHTQGSMQDNTVARLLSTRVQTSLSPFIKCNVLRESLSEAVFRIRCLFDPWVRDPGWVKSQDPGSGVNNPAHIS